MINPANFSSLIKFCNDARVINIEAFKSDVATQYLNNIPIFVFGTQHLQLSLELMVFTFVKFLRTADFSLYVECLTQLAPWFLDEALILPRRKRIRR